MRKFYLSGYTNRNHKLHKLDIRLDGYYFASVTEYGLELYLGCSDLKGRPSIIGVDST